VTHRKPHPDAALERRLLTLGEYVGAKDQKHMAALIGAKPTAWNNVMCGRDLSKDLAIKIHAKWPEITLEWALLGETNLLTGDTVRRLEEAEQRLVAKAER
jgi:hypothetical protein